MAIFCKARFYLMRSGRVHHTANKDYILILYQTCSGGQDMLVIQINIFNKNLVKIYHFASCYDKIIIKAKRKI